MRQYRPANKSASANRIRERYLHQLGLQRGSQPYVPHPLEPPYPNNHVVVISGLPSLPEERATTENTVLESHDFSNAQHTTASSCSGNDGESDASGSHRAPGDSTHCSQITTSPALSSTNSGETIGAVPMTSLALSYPKALLRIPPPPPSAPEASSLNGGESISYKSSSAPNNNGFATWRSAASLSKPAAFLLDSNDHDSVASNVTSTTAESSLFSAMVSRDWGAVQNPGGGASVTSQGGDSYASTPAVTPSQGVYFQCGHPRLLGNNSHGQQQRPQQQHCSTTSSLAHALNRFNIDSDCEASIASGSVVGCGGNSILSEDENNTMMDEDDASITSHSSLVSTASSKSHLSFLGRKKKHGKAQRLIDRAVAHERILQIRNDQSQKTRANLIHSSRMGRPQEASNQSASIPLMHVRHGASNQLHERATLSQSPSSSFGGDLGRTPTASNCSALRKLKGMNPPSHLFYPGLKYSMPSGVHVGEQVMPNPLHNAQGTNVCNKPLRFHPLLATKTPPPPPPKQQDSSRSPETTQAAAAITSMQHQHRRQASVEEVLEVAMALSNLGGCRNHGFVPRMR
jgi:hypothetical protein